jgi:hypothetical protein
MYDVKPQIKELLEAIPGVKKVSDAWPPDWKDLPQITIFEQFVSDHLKKGILYEIVLQIDVWHNRSTGAIAQQVEGKMNSIGFKLEFASDVPDPAVKHKTMRFRGIVDKRDLKVYQ